MQSITQAIHTRPVCTRDSHAESVALTSAYDFASAEQASARFSGAEPGNVYSRFTNPSVALFERKIAALEAGEAAVGLASGMAAYLTVGMTFLQQGDHVLIGSGIFGTTTHLFREYFTRFGIEVTSVAVNDSAAWQKKIKKQTRLLLVESPTNPMLQIAHLSSLAALAKKNNALLVVDNTLLSPIFQQPLTLGADIVLHSAGKFLDGQGRCVGGALIGKTELIKPARAYLRSTGVCMSPFNAWVFSKGLETLQARMLMHEQNCRYVYQALQQEAGITDLFATFHTQHPQRMLIQQQQKGHVPILTFRLDGDKARVWCFMNALKLVRLCTNIGDAQTMITHPASTTHGRYSTEERQKSGISDNLVRLCIGLDDPGDVVRDIQQALKSVLS